MDSDLEEATVVYEIPTAVRADGVPIAPVAEAELPGGQSTNGTGVWGRLEGMFSSRGSAAAKNDYTSLPGDAPITVSATIDQLDSNVQEAMSTTRPLDIDDVEGFDFVAAIKEPSDAGHDTNDSNTRFLRRRRK